MLNQTGRSPVMRYDFGLHTIAAVLFCTAMGIGSLAKAADEEGDTTAAAARLSAQELQELVGPIALYPDALLAIVLPASTFPLEIVQAGRYLDSRKKNPKLKPSESWDSSVLGLLNYPEVLDKMSAELDWTSKLGEAVVNQQSDVMDAIQQFRSTVHAAGNLQSNKQTVIVQEKEIIRIESATPDVIYVPSYQPATVVVQQPAPVSYVYSAPYPYYASPAATFWTGMFVGAAISYGVGWHGHGHNDINIARNVNISGNTINRGNVSSWKSARPPGSRVGRPATRARLGARPTAGGTARSARDGTNRAFTQSGGHRFGTPSAITSQRSRAQKSTSRATRPHGSSARGGTSRTDRSTRFPARTGSAFGGYERGRAATRSSQRGRASRASQPSRSAFRGASGRSSSRRSVGGGRRR